MSGWSTGSAAGPDSQAYYNLSESSSQDEQPPGWHGAMPNADQPSDSVFVETAAFVQLTGCPSNRHRAEAMVPAVWALAHDSARRGP
jgi:hypothetical protein